MGCLFLLLLSDFSSHWPPGLLLWAIFFGLIVVVGSLSALGWFSEKCILLGRKKRFLSVPRVHFSGSSIYVKNAKCTKFHNGKWSKSIRLPGHKGLPCLCLHLHLAGAPAEKSFRQLQLHFIKAGGIKSPHTFCSWCSRAVQLSSQKLCKLSVLVKGIQKVHLTVGELVEKGFSEQLLPFLSCCSFVLFAGEWRA